jgi:hypothetical protein
MPEARELYLDLMKRVLTNVIYEDPPQAVLARIHDMPENFDTDIRARGMDWPTVAHTMVGRGRLDNVHECLNQVIADDVPGDFIETGVWRGGVCIFARAFFKAHDSARKVWVADSFSGMPEVGESGNPLDRKLALHRFNESLCVPREAVERNFAAYGLLDDQVEFLPGWFRDTLPRAPLRELAVARLDGDLYESTADALASLYPRLSAGGFLIIDDYFIKACQAAVTDYRREFGIKEEIVMIDDFAAYWRRES